MFNKLKGDYGEKVACNYLKANKYRILNTKYTTEVGEIDIVCTDETLLIFVEVKTRENDRFGVPSEAVGYHKRVKINQVASQYIKKFRQFNIPVRFDVIEVYLESKAINHIVNAFDSYLRY